MESTTQLTTEDMAQTANEGAKRETREIPITDRSEEPNAEPLLASDASDSMRGRWETIQTGFVDDPRAAVKEADELVADGIRKLSDSFTQERSRLEKEWSQGNDVSTEDLRQALRRYRAFFHRLLAV
jgi:hypothetical protein